MHAGISSVPRTMLVTVVLASGSGIGTARAQAQPQGGAAPAGMLTLTSTSDAAKEELRAAMTDYFGLNWKRGADHAARALALDSSFGLARAWVATFTGGPSAAAELQRAATVASRATAGEALLALGAREAQAGRPANAGAVMDAAARLMPGDPLVALWRAATLADTARIAALRQVAAKYPDDAGSRIILAYYLTPLSFVIDSVATANGDEALRLAGEAVRLQPASSGAHTVMGHVLRALGRYNEAMPHLQEAASLTPKSSYAYDLIADLHARNGKIPEMRAALDSSIAWNANFNNAHNARRVRAATFLAEGDAQRCMADLAEQIRALEAAGARGELGTTHLWMALFAAGSRDSAGAMQHVAAAKTYNPAPGALADNEVITYSLIGNGPEARRALGDYTRIVMAANLTGRAAVTGTENVHRMTGLTLLAEKKPREAIAELRQGGKNPYVTVGIIEAYRMLKDTKQADAERAAFFARGEFTGNSSATAIIRYRAKKG